MPRLARAGARPALSPHLVLDNTRTALAFLDNPVTEGWP